MRQTPDAITILAEWPPGTGNRLPRLIEIQDDEDHSLNLGEWQQRLDGLWALRIPLDPVYDRE